MSALSKIFGSHSERELKRIYPIADKVESIMTAKSDMQNRIIYLREGYTGLTSL